MSDAGMLEEFLAGARVDAEVFALRPGYRSLLLAVDGLVPGPGDQDSDALGIGLPALVDMGRAAGLRVTRAGTAPVLWRGKLGGRAVLVAGAESPDVTELWDWTLGPGESHSSEAHTTGTRELLLVLDGQLELRVGQHAEVLGKGDSASFAGDLAHEYVNTGSAQVARFALTVFEPADGGGVAR